MELNIQPGQKALITTNAWFYGPDGRQYHAVFGTVKAVRDDQETLGVRSNRNSTNWYVEIGNMTIAGCQVYYAIRCDKCHFGPAQQSSWDAANGPKVFEVPCAIFNADAAAGEG